MDQALANFLTEVPQDEKMDFYIVKEPQVEIISTKSMSHEQCVLYTNGSLSRDGLGSRVYLNKYHKGKSNICTLF